MGSKTYVNSVTERLLESKNFHSSSDLGMQRYLYEQKTKTKPNMRGKSISDCLLGAAKGSMPKKFRSAYNLASNTDRYTYGLPQSYLSTTATQDINNSFETYLNTQETGVVEVIYSKLNSKNMYHYAWGKVFEDLGYSSKSNELKVVSVSKGTPCYLFSSQLTLSQRSYEKYLLDGNLEQNGLSMSYGAAFEREENPYREQPDILMGLNSKLSVVYAYEKGGEVLKGILDIILEDVNPAITEAEVEETPPIFDWWGIRIESREPNTLPTENEYIQAMYLVDGVMKIFSYEYQSGGIPEVDTSVSYEESIGQYYPRIYIREHARYTKDLPKDNIRRESTVKMLNKLGLKIEQITDQLHEAIGEVDGDYKYMFLHLTVSINKDKDDLTTGKYLFNYFDSLREVSGTIPTSHRKVPILSNEKGNINQSVRDGSYNQEISFWKTGKSIKNGIAKNNAGVELEIGDHCVKYKSLNYTGIHTIIKQINTSQYIELEVAGLVMRHKFYGQTVTAGGGDDNLTIPLDKIAVESLVLKDQELLVNRSLQLTITTMKVVKTKWYQTGIFKVVLVVISIAINIVIPGSGLTLMALLQAVATTIVIGIAVNLAVGLLVKLAVSIGLSSELVAVIAFIATLATLAATGRIDFSKVIDARALMNGLNIAKNAHGKSVAIGIETVKGKMDDFKEYADDQWKKLEAAQDMLDTGVIPPSLMMLTGPINQIEVYLGESAKEFYTRLTTIDVYDFTVNMVEYFEEIYTTPPKYKHIKTVNSVDITDVLLIT